MSTIKDPCLACHGESFCSLVDFGMVPRSGTFLSKPDESFARVHLSFEYCETCALIRQKSRNEKLFHDYTHIPRTTSRQLPTYTRQIAKSLLSQGVELTNLVVEIGANDGAFMDILAGEKFTNILAVEPSQACAQLCRRKGHRVEESYLDQSLAAAIREQYGLASAVVCRHTLEHVPDPSGFIASMQLLLCDGGVLFIEVPNAHTIIHDLLGHELWDEHLHIFSPENLAKIVACAGFELRRLTVWPQRGTSNILLWAVHRSTTTLRVDMPDDFHRDVQACARFQSRWKSMSEQVVEQLEHLKDPIAAIGASHPQSNYFLFSKAGSKVSVLVDDDPFKIGRFVPIPQAVPVISTTKFLHNVHPSSVILSAFGYEQWMDRLIVPFVTNDITIVRPYETRFLLSSQPENSHL
jgi:2-polyprenyl-3-methyl-5-hydroxy-6-metoxy-1,4-benzoquinol methylase